MLEFFANVGVKSEYTFIFKGGIASRKGIDNSEMFKI